MVKRIQQPDVAMAADAEDVGDLLPDQEFGDEVATLAQCHGPYLELGLRGEAGRVPRGNPADPHRLPTLSDGPGPLPPAGRLQPVSPPLTAHHPRAPRARPP